jgi:hypothetical protein
MISIILCYIVSLFDVQLMTVHVFNHSWLCNQGSLFVKKRRDVVFRIAAILYCDLVVFSRE